jgi:hypothetical protein
VKPKLKLKKACDVGLAEQSKLESGSVHVSGLGQINVSGQIFPIRILFPVQAWFRSRFCFWVYFWVISPPLPDQISPVKGVGVSPAKPLDEGLLGATCLVPVVVAVGSVSPVVD